MEHAVHYEYLDIALKTVKKLSVELWIFIALNGHHLGFVVEQDGPLFKQETLTEDFMVNITATNVCYKCKLFMCFALITTIVVR